MQDFKKNRRKKKYFSPSYGVLAKYLLSLLVGLALAFLYSSKKQRFELVSPLISSNLPVIENSVNSSGEINLRHKLKPGETIASVLDSYGLASFAFAVSKALEESKQEYALRSGETLLIKINSEGILSRIKIPIDRTQELLIDKAEADTYLAQLRKYRSEEKERISVGEIESSFAAATSRAGISYEVVDELVDIFSGKISFHRDFKKGDRFVVIYQDNIREDGQSMGNIAILAALIQVKGKSLVAVRFVGEDGKSRYFDQKAEPLQATFLRYPLKFSRISSGFSNARMHPVLNVKRPHQGVDFSAPVGTPVRTVADGTVIFSGRNGGAGIMLKIQHNQRIATAYLHLSKIEKGLKKGVKVEKGQVIGQVGQTGLATGPHLHFSFYDGEKAINPLKIELPMFELADSKHQINPTYLRRVLFTLDHYKDVALDSFYAAK